MPATPLPLLQAEQTSLLGFGAALGPTDAIDAEMPFRASVHPAQLSMTALQEVLREVPANGAGGRQLALLDYPPIWEADSSPPRPASPVRHRRGTRAPATGQMSLF